MTDLTDAGLRERASGVLLKWKTTEVCSLDECGTPQHEMQQVDLLVTLFTEDYIALRDAARAEQQGRDVKIVMKYLVYDSQRAVSWHEIQDCLAVIHAQGVSHG